MLNCSTCKQPTKGHPIPWGPQCTFGKINETEKVDIEDKSSGESDLNFGSLLKHMADIEKRGSASNPRIYNLMDVSTIPATEWSEFDPFAQSDIL